MQTVLANKMVSSTELRQPNKVIEEAKGKTVAVTNRNRIVGYFVPAEAVDIVDVSVATKDDVLSALKRRKEVMAPINAYLQDK